MNLTTTTKDVALAFGISTAGATRLASLEDSPAIRVNGVWRWPPIDQVRAWLLRRTDQYRTRPVDLDHNNGR